MVNSGDTQEALLRRAATVICMLTRKLPEDVVFVACPGRRILCAMPGNTRTLTMSRTREMSMGVDMCAEE